MSAFVRKAFSKACFYIPFLVIPITGVADNSDKHSDLKLNKTPAEAFTPPADEK